MTRYPGKDCDHKKDCHHDEDRDCERTPGCSFFTTIYIDNSIFPIDLHCSRDCSDDDDSEESDEAQFTE